MSSSTNPDYTTGEVTALVAPLLRCDPEDLLDVVIVGVGEEGPLMGSTITENTTRRTLAILAAVIRCYLDESADLD